MIAHVFLVDAEHGQQHVKQVSYAVWTEIQKTIDHRAGGLEGKKDFRFTKSPSISFFGKRKRFADVAQFFIQINTHTQAQVDGVESKVKGEIVL